MQHFIVGGCVRDVILGLNPKDIDHLWVGATPADMVAMGMHQVGAGFPVFLDSNGDEHALARIERKVGLGYNGFECEFDSTITVEQDLARRDLTINSMAVRFEDWDEFVCTKEPKLLIDPYGGLANLRGSMLHHTSEAFAEDPIRVLRAARFAARYDFSIHPSTLELMAQVVPELGHVPQERIWTEFEKGLMEPRAQIMLEYLQMCGALTKDGPLGIYAHNIPFVSLRSFKPTTDLTIRFVFVSAQSHTDEVYEFHRIPADIVRVCKAFYAHRYTLLYWESLSATKKIETLEALRAISQPELLIKLLEAMNVWVGDEFPRDQINKDLTKAKGVNAEAIAKACSIRSDIHARIFNARVAALE